jgi:hypothetical protein
MLNGRKEKVNLLNGIKGFDLYHLPTYPIECCVHQNNYRCLYEFGYIKIETFKEIKNQTRNCCYQGKKL